MRRFFAVLIALLMAGYAPAEAQQKPIFAVVLTRHGVRSPTHAPATYAWPNWGPVADGDLTQHGYALMTFLGAYYAKSFGDAGLPIQCSPANAFVYADVDQRTIETGRALIEGMCGSAWSVPLDHDAAMGPGAHDTLFDNAPSAKAPADTPTELEHSGADFAAMQQLLDGRCDGKCVRLIREPHALETASTYAENLFLEYAQCRPLAQIDPGQADVLTQLQSAMRLHSLEADVARRSEPIAQERGGNLLVHIAELLESKAPMPRSGVEGPDVTNDNVAFIVGHDTNISNVAGILGAHWRLSDGYIPDDTPPGGALVFELIRADDGTARVRLRFVHQTLAQLRSDVALPDGVVSSPVFLDGCSGVDCTMPIGDFAKIADRLVAAHEARPQWTPSSNGFVNLPALDNPTWTKCN